MRTPTAGHSASMCAGLTAPDVIVFTTAVEAVGYAAQLCGTADPTDAPSEITDPGPERIVLSPTARNSLRRDYFGQLLFNEVAAATPDVRVSEAASHESSFAVTDEQVAVSTPIQDVTVATTADDEETVATARDAAMQAFEDGDPYKVPGGTLAEFREAMTDQFDEALYEDFVTALRASGDLVDQQRAVVAAAANDCSLYALSTLLEDRGLSSKATISRAKTTLEDVGAIETTQIEQDVGRPRQRLHLADAEVREEYPDVATVVAAVQ